MPNDPALSLFTAALGLAPPWKVLDIDFDETAKRIDFRIGYDRGSRFACPACEAAQQPVHDRRTRDWQHLHFFEHRAFLHAEVPRVRCGECGKTSQVTVPWARPGSGFSQLFEAMIVTLSTHMPANTVARLLGIGDDAVWRILHHYVDRARAVEDFSGVTAVGIDETAARRGHDYITLFHDMDARRVLFACPGRDQSTVATFVEDMRAHGGSPEQIEAVSIDMSKAYIAGVARHRPGRSHGEAGEASPRHVPGPARDRTGLADQGSPSGSVRHQAFEGGRRSRAAQLVQLGPALPAGALQAAGADTGFDSHRALLRRG